MFSNQLNKYSLLSLIIFSILCIEKIVAAPGENNTVEYREQVYLHINRDIFVNGETIWYQAYCFSENSPNNLLYSKALYVEIVDLKNRQMAGQTIEIIHGIGSAALIIPDTLSSGQYLIKAYTQWMRNFGADCFYTHPIYVYNEYSEPAKNKTVKQFGLLPEFYIEDDKLLDSVPTDIYLFPAVNKISIPAILKSSGPDSLSLPITPTENGLQKFSFSPLASSNYTVNMGSVTMENNTINLPPVQKEGICLRLIQVTAEGPIFRIYSTPSTRPTDYSLKAMNKNQIVAEKTIKASDLEKEFLFPVTTVENCMLEFLLQSKDKVWEDRKTYLINPSPIATVNQENLSYKTRSEVVLKPEFLPADLSKGGQYSISICKSQSKLITSNDIFQYCTLPCNAGQYKVIEQTKAWSLILPVNENTPAQLINTNAAKGKSNELLPVEEKGIVLSGHVTNPITETPLMNVDVLLAVKDSLPHVITSKTDSSGRFVFLLKNVHSNKAVIRIYKDEENLIGNYSIQFDSKFDSPVIQNSKYLFFDLDSSFTDLTKNESQRFKIQRAFINPNPANNLQAKESAVKEVKFYGEPEMTIYPGIFFMLPNFEEIAREIVPKLKYKKNKNGCSISVYSGEESNLLTTPLVIVDGIPIANPCDIYPLNSDDIDRIELQSERRISGNLIYSGLVAIYTTPDRKKTIEQKLKKEMVEIPYYYNGPTFSELQKNQINIKNQQQPNFQNQLYWSASLAQELDKNGSLKFYTSDEVGEFTIDIQGINANGMPVHIQSGFTVKTQ